MYGVTKKQLTACPKARRRQDRIAKLKLRRAQKRRARSRKRLSRKIRSARRQRDRALLKCKIRARNRARIQARRASRKEGKGMDTAPGFDPYATEMYDVQSQGMVNGDEMYEAENGMYESGMGAAGEGDYVKLVGGLVGLSLFIGGAIYITNRVQEARA